MFWADSLGSKYIYSRLEEWSKQYGGFFKPCGYLAERAAQGATLVRNLHPNLSELIFHALINKTILNVYMHLPHGSRVELLAKHKAKKQI